MDLEEAMELLRNEEHGRGGTDTYTVKEQTRYALILERKEDGLILALPMTAVFAAKRFADGRDIGTVHVPFI